MTSVKYNSDWIDNLHPSEATIFGNDEFCPPEFLSQPDPGELKEWLGVDDDPPIYYRDPIDNYWSERMWEKYGLTIYHIDV